MLGSILPRVIVLGAILPRVIMLGASLTVILPIVMLGASLTSVIILKVTAPLIAHSHLRTVLEEDLDDRLRKELADEPVFEAEVGEHGVLVAPGEVATVASEVFADVRHRRLLGGGGGQRFKTFLLSSVAQRRNMLTTVCLKLDSRHIDTGPSGMGESEILGLSPPLKCTGRRYFFSFLLRTVHVPFIPA
jgi:hypothetical protein